MKKPGKASSKHTILENRSKLQDAIELRLPGDPKYLKIIRLALVHCCAHAGFSTDDGQSIALATDEACTNIIKHAYSRESSEPINVVIRIIKNGIQIILRDFGKKVEEKELKSRDLDDIRPGGLGIHFISSIMDKITYDNSCREGNKLVMTKYLPQY